MIYIYHETYGLIDTVSDDLLRMDSIEPIAEVILGDTVIELTRVTYQLDGKDYDTFSVAKHFYVSANSVVSGFSEESDPDRPSEYHHLTGRAIALRYFNNLIDDAIRNNAAFMADFPWEPELGREAGFLS